MIFIIRNPRHNHPKSINNRRIAVIEHPDINKEHIDRALTDKNFYVRKSAIQHPNATKEQLNKALNHKWSEICEGAMNLQLLNKSKEV